MLTEAGLLHDLHDADKCEYLVPIDWLKTVSLEDAKFVRKAGIFSSQQIVCSIEKQSKTLKFLETEFKVRMEKLLAGS